MLLPGLHNLENALGVIAISRELEVSCESINAVLSRWSGIKRRLDLVAEVKDIKVYDDCAHHLTAIRATLEALRQQNPEQEIWALGEIGFLP
jgi:UDP-N-acetylmuramate: L-alanyl-gamma-D-glutamyl-meso-diaminopimelate ligase